MLNPINKFADTYPKITRVLLLTLKQHIFWFGSILTNQLYLSLLLIVIMLFYSTVVLGQTSSFQNINSTIDTPGSPFIKNYTNTDIGGEYTLLQTFSSIRSNSGLMYFGFLSGIFEYDGVRWYRLNKADGEPFKTPIYNFVIDKNGIIYACGENTIGYLQPNSSGQMSYVSLTERVDKSLHPLGDFFNCHAIGDAIYFQSNQHILKWQDSEFQVISTAEKTKSYFNTFYVNGRYFVSHNKSLLFEMINDSLHVIRKSAIFSGANTFAILGYDDTKLLIVTREKGLFFLDSQNLVIPFITTLGKQLNTLRISGGAILSNNIIALATYETGVVLLKKSGQLIQILDKQYGISDNMVWQIRPERNGGFWLALNSGISFVESPLLLTVFDERSGLDGVISSIIRHNDRVHVGTASGVYTLRESNPPSFLKLPKYPSQCWDLLSVNGALIVAADDMVMLEKKGGSTKYITNQKAYQIYQSPSNEDLILLGLYGKLGFLVRQGEEWNYLGDLQLPATRVLHILEDEPGHFWLGIEDQNTILVQVEKIDSSYIASHKRLNIATKFLPNATVSIYNTTAGLPRSQIRPVKITNRTVFLADDGHYTFDKSSGQFSKNTIVSKEGAKIDKEGIYRASEDSDKNIWVHSTKNNNYRMQWLPDGTLQELDSPLIRLPKTQFNSIYPEDKDIVWFGGTDILVRYDMQVPHTYADTFQTLITGVKFNDDSLLFDGSHSAYLQDTTLIEYEYNDLRFDFACPSFINKSDNRYQFYLEGFQESDSLWHETNFKDYTNIPEGNYIFRVRSKNAYGQIGPEATFHFTISPPIWRTWLAYLLYALVIAAVLYSIRRYELGRQKLKYDLALEKIRSDKAAETEQIRSHFLENLSHEFRTPLTLILGPLVSLQKRIKDAELQSELNMMKRNGRRLLQLINNLLDLSSLKLSALVLQAQSGGLYQFVKIRAASFESLAFQKNIELVINEQESDNSYIENVFFDSEKLESVINNLVANALKSTPSDGKVSVNFRHFPSRSDLFKDDNSISGRIMYKQGCISISVSDTGSGIAEDQLPHIFKRFYTTGEGLSSDQYGTGIGLSISREFVELHRGRLDVESMLGKGSEFIIHLPVGKDHLTPQEIIADFHLPATESSSTKSIAIDEIDYNSNDAQESSPLLLIVEDNEDMALFISAGLRQYYKIIIAEDGQAGLNTAIRHMPDLIISDIMMPNMNGYELCDQIKRDERSSHIPVILLTAKSTIEDKIQGLKLGADDYLTKPFSSEELRTRVQNLIEQRRILRERFSREIKLQPKDIAITSADLLFLERLTKIIEGNLENTDFSVEQFGRKVGMDRSNLFRKLKSIANLTPVEFIQMMRLKRAADLLEKNYGTIAEIAYKVGLEDPSYFTRIFKKRFGVTPTEYKSSLNKK